MSNVNPMQYMFHLRHCLQKINFIPLISSMSLLNFSISLLNVCNKVIIAICLLFILSVSVSSW